MRCAIAPNAATCVSRRRRSRRASSNPIRVSHRTWPPQAANFAFFLFAYYGYAGMFMPYASLFFAERGMTAAEIGILMSLMQVMRILGPNFWGWIADRHQQRVRVLRMTALAAAAAFCGIFAGQTFILFFIVMVAINAFT